MLRMKNERRVNKTYRDGQATWKMSKTSSLHVQNIFISEEANERCGDKLEWSNQDSNGQERVETKNNPGNGTLGNATRQVS